MSDSKLTKVTAMGVTVEVDPEALDDWELFDCINTYGANSTQAVCALTRALFDADTLATVKEALKDEHGKLKATKMAEFVGEVGSQLDSLKN